MELYDVVAQLAGPINPVGETHTDNERFENLKVMTALVDTLLADIERVAAYKDRPEYSMSKAGTFAHAFLFVQIGIVE